MSVRHSSWGGTIAATHVGETVLNERKPFTNSTPTLAVGYGRSYGDVCLNNGGSILLPSPEQGRCDFDSNTGVLTVSASMSLHRINEVVIPQGWILPVLPGTGFVSVGGAIANDIHGKNHHRRGTFGCSIVWIDLATSTGGTLRCSRTEHAELFRATIGGLGLTGIILRASIQLMPIESSVIQTTQIKTRSLEETINELQTHDETHEYSVAWVDCSGHRGTWGRGHVIAGNHATSEKGLQPPAKHRTSALLPSLGNYLMSPTTVRVGSLAKYHLQVASKVEKFSSHNEYFHPLDGIHYWNKAYGKRGFFQFQFVVPNSDVGRESIEKMFTAFSNANVPLYLVVVKLFGNIQSPGLLSFPKEGITIAIDIPNRNDEVVSVINLCESIALEAGGRVYPAKDATLQPHVFQKMYPQWEELERFRDPEITNSFWRRVTQ